MHKNLACAALAAAAVVIVGVLLTRETPPLLSWATGVEPPAPSTLVYPNPAPAAAAKRTIPAAELQAWGERLSARRAAQLENLRIYALAGLYPRNTDTPDRRIPVFVDDRNTACAVGHLMRASGREALVGSIRVGDNHVRVMDIKDGPALDKLTRR